METTGYYWYNLAQYIIEHDMKVFPANPYHVRCAGELDDDSPTKNDRKDPKTIAVLVKGGRYLVPYIHEADARY
ncbi:MAG: IS110 family transposase [Limnochordia bacterium]|jgi:transposase|nr:IS110 family transposase [Limnochordia bacterium]